MDKKKKKALKNAARNAERQALKELLPASPMVLSSLFEFLDRQLPGDPCQRDLRLTGQWCRVNNLEEAKVFAWTKANGGFCDCEVLANVQETLDEASKA
jgi:hypothetical protein